MGRIVESFEHNIQGEVSIGRSPRPGLVLPPELLDKIEVRIREIRELQQLTRGVVGEMIQIIDSPEI